jgi:hypothetical protein
VAADTQLLVNLHVRVPGTLTAFELNQLEEQIVACSELKVVLLSHGILSLVTVSY